MCRRDHPSFPSEITCCFLSVLKTLLMPSEPIRALSGVNVPGFPMAGFQLTLYGRIWATPEDDRTAQFLETYRHYSPVPKSGPHVFVVELFTPYAQAVEASSRHG